MSEFTQGVCADGAAILKDGVMLTIEEIIELLRQGDKLMGAGEEPVAWRYWNEKSKSWNETHSKLVAEAMGEGGRKVEPLYTQAPTVDSAVLLDAALFRWLIDGPRSSPVWNNVLTEEQRYGHCDIRAAIIAAMKGGG